MGKRLFCSVAVGMTVGILLAHYQSNVLFLGVLPSVFVCLLFFYGRKRGRKQSVWFLLLFAAATSAMFLSYQRQSGLEQMRRTAQLRLNEQDIYYLQGKLVKKQQKENTYQYELSSCQIRQEPSAGQTAEILTFPKSYPGRVQVIFTTDLYSIGETLLLKGKIKFFEQARNEGNFDPASFYPAMGIEFQMTEAQVLGHSGTGLQIGETLYQLKKKISAVYENLLPQKEAGVLLTMVLGDKTKLMTEIKKSYQMVGLSHILAISGLHISIIGMLFYKAMRKLRTGFLGAMVPSVLLLSAYAQMTGETSSVIRAVCMFFLWMLAQLAGRSYDLLNAAGVAATLLLFENPGYLFYAGFQLSFAAVIAVGLFGNIETSKQKEENREKIREKIRMGAALQLATLPLVAWYYYEIPIYALLVNFLLLPFVSILLCFGIAGGVVGLFSHTFASACFLPCRILLLFYETVCGLVKKLPCPLLITGRPEPQKLLVYYGILLFYVAWSCYREKCKKNRKEPEEEPKKKAVLTAYVRMAGGVALFLLCFLFPAKEAEISFLDVGQGDCGYICSKEGVTLMVDGGSTNITRVGACRMEPFLKYKGVRKVDYWVVSHTDADHISGLEELLEDGYHIGSLVFAKEMEKDEAFVRLKKRAKQNGTALLYLNQGDVLHLGEAALTVLSPGKNLTGDKNAKSLVVCYEENGISVLFSGDISAKEEKLLVETGHLRQVTIYKAAHHGSNYSNSNDFLEALSPKVAVVSCAKRNRYGHPGKEAVERLKKNCDRLFYTMENGQVSVKPQKRFASFCIFQYSRKEFIESEAR